MVHIGFACQTRSISRVRHVHAVNSHNYFNKIFKHRYLQNLDPQKFSAIWLCSQLRTSLGENRKLSI